MDDSNTVALAGVIVAVAGVLVGCLIAVMQHWLGRKAARLQATLHLFDKLQETKALEARFRVRAIMARAESLGNDFDKLPDEDRAALVSIASHFGLASLLNKHGKIDLAVFMDAYGDSVRRNYERLLPYKKWRDGRHDGPDSLWRHFENLYELAKKRRYLTSVGI